MDLTPGGLLPDLLKILFHWTIQHRQFVHFLDLKWLHPALTSTDNK